MAPKTSPRQSPTAGEWGDLLGTFRAKYTENTPRKLQLIDIFFTFAVILAIVQAVYAFTSGSFPYNSYLAGLFCSFGFAILLVCLRLQVANPKEFGNITAESAFAGFIIGCLALFAIVTTFMG